MWSIILLLHYVLLMVSMVFLISFKTSWVNKLLWTPIMFFFPLIGSICFLIWRRYELRKQKEQGCGSEFENKN